MAKILVVDDEREIANLFYDMLAKEGFQVLIATGGQDCLRLAEKEKPDLILLDVMMPGMDGGETMQNLLDNEKTKNIPTIFLTSIISKDEEIEQLGKIGNRLFISKFSDRENLLKKVNEILGIGT
jgi:two-component system response regulator VicR